MSVRTSWLSGDWLAALAFGAACSVGLVGAFIGLGVSSFWYDELYTAWVVGSESRLADVASRAATDVHPPLYYFLLFGFSKIVGNSDEALRLFSAVWATAAILLFIISTGSAFSLPARLFSAALATGSNFWFYQSQNARFYALEFFIGTCILATSLALLRPRKPEEQHDAWLLTLLFGVMLFGSFSHFYLLYLSLAVLMLLGFLAPRLRIAVAALVLTLLLLGFLYLKVVIGTYAQFRVESSWMGGGPDWYLNQLSSARQAMANKWAILALFICALAWMAVETLRGSLRRSERSSGQSAAISFLSENWRSEDWRWDPVAVLAIGVPIIVLIGGIVSSIILSPNFQDRNLLVCSPFVWAGYAKLYDVGVARLAQRPRMLADAALALTILYTSSIVVGRSLPRNPPIREASHRILDFEGCKGEIVPVVDATSTQWTKPGYLEIVTPAVFGRYLGDFAVVTHVYAAHLEARKLPSELRTELQRRIDGNGCQLLLWYGHKGSVANVEIATKQLLAALERPNVAPFVRSEFFQAHNYGMNRNLSEEGIFILYVDRKSKSRGG